MLLDLTTRYRSIICLIFVGLASFPALGDQTALQCDLFSDQLTKEGSQKSVEMRPKANKHCLKCDDDSCALKAWPEGNPQEAAICKRIYCTPISSPKEMFSDNSWGSFEADIFFDITKNGRGKFKSVFIKDKKVRVYEKEIEKTLTKYLRGVRFTPLKINGAKYPITNAVTKFEYVNRKTNPLQRDDY